MSYQAVRDIRGIGGDVFATVSNKDVLIGRNNENLLSQHALIAVYLGRHTPKLSVTISRGFEELDDRLLTAVRNTPTLVLLDLSGLRVDDNQLKQLKGLKGLRVIYLDFTRVSDVSIETLLSFPDLEYVNIKGTKITQKGLQKLSAERPNLEID